MRLKDEIDALATSRASGDGDSGTGSHEGVLTSLLNEMDGVEELIGVTIVAATNRPDVIVSCDMITPHPTPHCVGFGPDAPWTPGPYSLRRASRPTCT